MPFFPYACRSVSVAPSDTGMPLSVGRSVGSGETICRMVRGGKRPFAEMSRGCSSLRSFQREGEEKEGRKRETGQRRCEVELRPDMTAETGRGGDRTQAK